VRNSKWFSLRQSLSYDMSLKGQTSREQGTLIVCYVPNELVESYLVPDVCLTLEDIERLKEAHGEELCEPSVVSPMNPERQHSLELNAYLRARMDKKWAKYRVPSTLGQEDFVEIQGRSFPLGRWTTTEDNAGKGSTLEIERVFWFTIEY
jgi:hypothetical protein